MGMVQVVFEWVNVGVQGTGCVLWEEVQVVR